MGPSRSSASWNCVPITDDQMIFKTKASICFVGVVQNPSQPGVCCRGSGRRNMQHGVTAYQTTFHEKKHANQAFQADGIVKDFFFFFFGGYWYIRGNNFPLTPSLHLLTSSNYLQDEVLIGLAHSICTCRQWLGGQDMHTQL